MNGDCTFQITEQIKARLPGTPVWQWNKIRERSRAQRKLKLRESQKEEMENNYGEVDEETALCWWSKVRLSPVYVRKQCKGVQLQPTGDTSALDWESGRLRVPDALQGGRSHCVHLLGSWVGPRDRFDILERRKISCCCCCCESHRYSTNVQPVA